MPVRTANIVHTALSKVALAGCARVFEAGKSRLRRHAEVRSNCNGSGSRSHARNRNSALADEVGLQVRPARVL
jgi:hypothetical protein